MFLRVSSLGCASDVDTNPRPITPCRGRPHNVELLIHMSASRSQRLRRRGLPQRLGIFVAEGGPDASAGLDIDADFVVAVGRAGLSGQEQHPGAPGREPAREELGGARGTERLAEQHLEPAADVAQLGRTAAQHREDRKSVVLGKEWRWRWWTAGEKWR